MKRTHKFLMSLIACVLAVSFVCISVSAADIAKEITDEVVRNSEFPLDITISSVSENRNEVSLTGWI